MSPRRLLLLAACSVALLGCGAARAQFEGYPYTNQATGGYWSWYQLQDVGVVSQLVEAINERVASLGPRTNQMGVALTPFCYVQTHRIFDHMETLGTARTPVYNEVVTTNQLSPFTYGGKTIHPVLTRDFFDLLDQKLLDITPYFVDASTNWVDDAGTLNKWFQQSITNRPTVLIAAIPSPLVNPGWAYWKTDWWWTNRGMLEHGYELPAGYPTVITPGIDVPGTNVDRWVQIDFPTNYPYLTPAQVMTNAHIGFLAFPPSTNDEFGLVLDGGYDFFTRQPFTTNPAVAWEMTYAPTNGDAGRWVTHTIQPFKEFIVDSQPVWRTLAPSGTTASVTFDATGIALVNAIVATHQMMVTQTQHVAASTGADVTANATWIEVDDVSGIAGVAPTGTTVSLVYTNQHSFGPFPNFASAYDINERVDYLKQLVWTTNPYWAWVTPYVSRQQGSYDFLSTNDVPTAGSPWTYMSEDWDGMFPPSWGIDPWAAFPSPADCPWRPWYDAVTFINGTDVDAPEPTGAPRYSWTWEWHIDWEEKVDFSTPVFVDYSLTTVNWEEIYAQYPWFPGQFQIDNPSFGRSSGVSWTRDIVTAIDDSYFEWTGCSHETDFYIAYVYTRPDYPIKFWSSVGPHSDDHCFSTRVDPSHSVTSAVGFVGDKVAFNFNGVTNITRGPFVSTYTNYPDIDAPSSTVTYVMSAGTQTVGNVTVIDNWYGTGHNEYYRFSFPDPLPTLQQTPSGGVVYLSYATNAITVSHTTSHVYSDAATSMPKAQDPPVAGVTAWTSIETNITTVTLSDAASLIQINKDVYSQNYDIWSLETSVYAYTETSANDLGTLPVANDVPVTNITAHVIRWAASGTTNIGYTLDILYEGTQKQDGYGATNATVLSLPPLLKWDVDGGYKRR